MNNLIDFLKSDEAIMVYIIASIISVTYIIYYYFRKTKITRLQRQNTMELNKIIDEVGVNEEFENKRVSTLVENKETKVMPIIEKEAPVVSPIESEKIESLEVEQIPINTNVSLNTVVEEKKIEPGIEKTPITPFVYQPVNMKVEGTIEVLETEPVIPSKKEETPTKIETINKKEKLDEVLKKIYPKENLEKVELMKEDLTVEIPVINVDTLLAEEDILYTNTVPDVEEAKKELEEVTKKLEQEENKTITLTEFEQLQEDTAIISLDELMKKAGTMYEVNEQIQYKDEGNEPISISDLEKRKQEMLSKTEEVKLSSEKIEETKKERKHPSAVIMKNTKNKIFKSSKVISPVYGMKKSTELELENTANYEKLDEEIRKTNEFLATLKELQKKVLCQVVLVEPKTND